MLKSPATIQLARRATPAVGITQAVYPVPQELKSGLLAALLERGEMREALVFTRTKHRADRVAAFLARLGVKAQRIHGNRSQAQRTQALAGFKEGYYRVLVATDIAARGLDIPGITHVLNFELPNIPEAYVHRIGRTARAGRSGTALSFCDVSERGFLRDIERAIRRRLDPVNEHSFASPVPVLVPLGAPGAAPPSRPFARRFPARRSVRATRW
jgi:ATP-dependent RNA helicase RhlE